MSLSAEAEELRQELSVSFSRDIATEAEVATEIVDLFNLNFPAKISSPVPFLLPRARVSFLLNPIQCREKGVRSDYPNELGFLSLITSRLSTTESLC